MPTTTKYIWDDDNYLAEADATDTINVVYTNEPQRYGNLVSTRILGTTSYHHFDAIGATRQLTNPSGRITDVAIYDAWGNVSSRSGTSSPHMLWVGAVAYYSDPEILSMYVRRRPYIPATARWTAVDPLAVYAVRLPYVYARNRPVVRFDPSGLKDVSVTIYIDDLPVSLNCGIPDDPKAAACDARLMTRVGLTDAELKTCQDAVNKAMKDDVVIDLYKSFPKYSKCPIPTVVCVCCKTGGAACKDAGAWHSGNGIYFCAEKKSTETYILQTLRHELTHHWQSCAVANGTGNDCSSRLKAEFQASYCSGKCNDFEKCFYSAVWSACYVRLCQPADLQTQADSLMGWFSDNRESMCIFNR